MGLLDDLLAGATGQRSQATNQQAGAGGFDTRTILMALMPVVLGMVANRSRDTRAQPGPGAGAAAGGGLSDILGSMLGGGSGAGGGGLNDILGSMLGGAGGAGGLGGLLGKLQQAGYGDQAQSWVSRGQNQPLPASAIEQTFGRDGLAQLARLAGLSEADASRGLSQLLPEVVNEVTPDGNVPAGDSLLASVEALARRYSTR